MYMTHFSVLVQNPLNQSVLFQNCRRILNCKSSRGRYGFFLCSPFSTKVKSSSIPATKLEEYFQLAVTNPGYRTKFVDVLLGSDVTVLGRTGSNNDGSISAAFSMEDGRILLDSWEHQTDKHAPVPEFPSEQQKFIPVFSSAVRAQETMEMLEVSGKFGAAEFQYLTVPFRYVLDKTAGLRVVFYTGDLGLFKEFSLYEVERLRRSS